MGQNRKASDGTGQHGIVWCGVRRRTIREPKVRTFNAFYHQLLRTLSQIPHTPDSTRSAESSFWIFRVFRYDFLCPAKSLSLQHRDSYRQLVRQRDGQTGRQTSAYSSTDEHSSPITSIALNSTALCSSCWRFGMSNTNPQHIIKEGGRKGVSLPSARITVTSCPSTLPQYSCSIP